MDDYELQLYHHGILGMKWGIRRYQNANGSLTAAGKKRYGTKANFEKVQAAKRAAQKANSKEAKAKRKANERTAEEVAKYRAKAGLKDKPDDTKKSVKDMSDDELRKVVSRLQLERQYKDLNPESVSAGKTFVNEVLAPAAKNAGKNVLQDYITKQSKEILGLSNNNPDELADLQKTVRELTLKKQLKKLKEED